MPRRYTKRSKEEKLAIVLQNLSGVPIDTWESQGIGRAQVSDWVNKYRQKGEKGLDTHWRKPGTELVMTSAEALLLEQIEQLREELIRKENELLHHLLSRNAE